MSQFPQQQGAYYPPQAQQGYNPQQPQPNAYPASAAPAYAPQQQGYQQQPQGGYQQPQQGYQQQPPQQQQQQQYVAQVPPWAQQAAAAVRQGFPPAGTNDFKFVGQVQPNKSMPNGFQIMTGGRSAMLQINCRIIKSWHDRKTNTQKVFSTSMRIVMWGPSINQVASSLSVGAWIAVKGEFGMNSYEKKDQTGQVIIDPATRQPVKVSYPQVKINGQDPEGLTVLGVTPVVDTRPPQQQQQGGYQQQPPQGYQQGAPVQQGYQQPQQQAPAGYQQPQQYNPGPQYAPPQQQAQQPAAPAAGGYNPQAQQQQAPYGGQPSAVPQGGGLPPAPLADEDIPF